MSGMVLIFSGGDPLRSDQIALLPEGDDVTVIGADSGVDRALAAGCAVDVAVGDFDSVTAAGLARAEESGAEIQRHPASKNETDLELAIAAGLERRPDRLLLVAMSGGRPDHELAGMMLLADPSLVDVDVDVLFENARVAVVRSRRIFTGQVGDLLSLIPIGGDAVGVTTTGLEYPLDDETLEFSKSRGVSNVFAAPIAEVSVRSGVLFAYQIATGDAE